MTKAVRGLVDLPAVATNKNIQVIDSGGKKF